MKNFHQPSYRRIQGGFVSIVALLFVIIFVLFIMTQSFVMLKNKNVDSVQFLDGMKALYIAESGIERAYGRISNAVNINGTQIDSACAAAKLDNNGTANPIPFASGNFFYASTTLPAPPTGTCDIRVTGNFSSAQRTIQSRIRASSEIGTAGFGSNITMKLKNNASTPGVALFNMAWRRQGSTGHTTSGGQADASACTLPACGLQWNIESSSGLPSVGSMGTAVNVAANGAVDVVQTLSSGNKIADRNYAEVGIVMPGLSAQPVIIGSFSDNKRTANTQNNTVTTGDTSNGQLNAWCNAADTLVFGVSGRSNDSVTGAFASVLFNTTPLNWIAHYPNTDGTTPNVFGDIFTEIWYTYNPYVMISGATSVGTTVTVSSPVSLTAGTILKVYSGTGALANSTKVLTSVSNKTQFQLTSTPTTPLSNATICGGICALFNNPALATSSTTFTLTRASPSEQQWASGFTCLRGVDPANIRRVSRSDTKIIQWNEVISDF